jgi:hypothetical protein
MNIKNKALNITFDIALSDYETRAQGKNWKYIDVQNKMEELLTALHDSIKLKKGEVPESAFPFFCDEEFKTTETRN